MTKSQITSTYHLIAQPWQNLAGKLCGLRILVNCPSERIHPLPSKVCHFLEMSCVHEATESLYMELEFKMFKFIIPGKILYAQRSGPSTGFERNLAQRAQILIWLSSCYSSVFWNSSIFCPLWAAWVPFPLWSQDLPVCFLCTHT
jgi:hypothetical protein